MILNRLLDDKIPKLRWCKRCKTLKTIYDFDRRKDTLVNVCHSCKVLKPYVVKGKTPDAVIDDCTEYNLDVFRKCSKCGQIKSIFENFRNATQNIKHTICKDCAKMKDVIYRSSLKQKLKNIQKITPLSKFCSGCGEVKLIEFFGNSNITKDGKTTQCKDCNNQLNRCRRKNLQKDKKEANKLRTSERNKNKKEKRRAELEILDLTTTRLVETYKICIKCNISKQLTDFVVDWSCVDGRKNCCRECNNKADRDRYAKDEVKREKNSAKNKKYNLEKKDQRTAYNNKPEVKARNAENRHKNIKRRRAEDAQYYVIETLRNSLRTNLKRYSETGKVFSSKKYGIDYASIFKHIGPQPTDPENKIKWEMDHIIPCAVFPDLNIEGMAALLYHPSNLQWLSKEKNVYKWNHIIPDMIREHNLEWICEKIGIKLEEHEQNNYMLNIIKQEE